MGALAEDQSCLLGSSFFMQTAGWWKLEEDIPIKK